MLHRCVCSRQPDNCRVAWRPPGVELLLLKFRDRLRATDFGSGKDHLVAGLQGIEREAVLYFEIISSAAGICADRFALRLLNCNLAIQLTDLSD
jgi:hypothetical protein